MFSTQSDNCIIIYPYFDISLLAQEFEQPKVVISGKGLTTLKKNSFENIVGKGESAGNQHFLLFPQCFLPRPKPNFSFSVTFFFVICRCFQFGPV